MIDAHQHIWRLGRHGHSWPTPDLAVIHRDHEVADLEALAAPLGVTGSVLVQSQPCDEDTDFLLHEAAHQPFVRGVVGWADMKAPDAPARIAALAVRPKMRGLRPMLQSLPVDWIADPSIDAAARVLVACGLSFDALVLPPHLPALLDFARRHPDLAMVIDHGAKPPIARGEIDDWAASMRDLAALPQVHAKLSGLLTEAGDRTTDDALKPYVDILLDAFGPDRLMWGSDWPVLNLAGDYAGWLAMARDLVPAEVHPAVFDGTARRFYRL
ncbi:MULTISPECIES: amidohydrolase family protein [Nitrospirillum]|uniref:L-fuconolactonase n=1 Tax=Nitrospirillum amazonense TaxID=28077 RepID=A0A560FKS4_9PROT|nr:amidohydrolase family protein [Nitrospirillum amazonense]MEC4590818.1 amidohydrolase family protein [Nitrospirillum amazonense]TWB22204.1 L-fuconolactonase [Nitrospirillum amazonense]